MWKSAEGNGSSGPLSDCLLQIRKLCGFLHLSLFPFFILPALVYVPGFFWRKKENAKHIEQIIVSTKRQTGSETEGQRGWRRTGQEPGRGGV